MAPSELAARVALVEAVRDLNLAAATAFADDEELARATESVRRLTEDLKPLGVERVIRSRFEEPADWARTGRSMPINLLNPALPELLISFTGDWAAADAAGDPTGLGASATLVANSLHEGPTDSLHGGVSALLMDCILGFLVQAWGEPAVTGNLTTRYLARTPLEEELRLSSRVSARSGRKITVTGTIEHAGGVCVEASGLFVVIDRATFRSSLPRPPADD